MSRRATLDNSNFLNANNNGNYINSDSGVKHSTDERNVSTLDATITAINNNNQQMDQQQSGNGAYSRLARQSPCDNARNACRTGTPTRTGKGKGRAKGSGGNYSHPPVAQVRPTDFPLRILVLSDMVGAIIGKSGGTIRQITQETRARVDVHRKENTGSPEKVITIYGASSTAFRSHPLLLIARCTGNPENCSKACRKIVEVMTEEAANTTHQEIQLKILAHNSLIGRIIGKVIVLSHHYHQCAKCSVCVLALLERQYY